MAEEDMAIDVEYDKTVCDRKNFAGSLVKMSGKEKHPFVYDTSIKRHYPHHCTQFGIIRLTFRERFFQVLTPLNSFQQRQLKRPPRVFSEQFLVYVEREMDRCVGASDEEKFQIYREVFQYLIEQFGEHRQILSDIKVEYDSAIKRRDARIFSLQDSERQLNAEKERHARRLKTAQVQAYREVEELQRAQAQLRHRIATLCEEKQKIRDELDEVRESLLVEQRRYREEHEVRQVAEVDLAELAQRYDNLLRRANSRPPADTRSSSAADDPIVLRVALTKCREQLSAASARLVVLETSYSEVVPRRDLELALAETERVRAQGQEQVAALELALQQEKELEMRRTPRPDWARASDYVPGGASTWMPLRGTLPSCDVMVTLLDQLSAPGPDTFAGLGVENEVIPVFLKWHGKVKNNRMTRRQVMSIICDIFECREENKDSFQDFVYMYFKERYPFTWPEWSYSFHYALERLTADDAHHLLVGLEGPADEQAEQKTAADTPPDQQPADQTDQPSSNQSDQRPASQPNQPPVSQPDQPPTNQPDQPPANQPDQPPANQPDQPPATQPSPAPSPPAARPSATAQPPRGSGSGAGSAGGTGQAVPPPERLKQILDERERRLASARSGSEQSTRRQSAATRSLSVTEEGETSREATAPPIPQPIPEVQNRHIQLFWNVLYGTQHEAFYARERNAIQQLKKEFCVADAEKQGKVLYDSLGRIISETYFSTKTDEEIERLVLAAAFGNPEMDTTHLQPVETVNYSYFLDMCRETDSAFLHEFYQQADRAGAAYADQLRELLDDGDVIQRSTLTQAVTSLTPDVVKEELERMCGWICPEEGQGVPLEAFVYRLRGLPLPPESAAAEGETS